MKKILSLLLCAVMLFSMALAETETAVALKSVEAPAFEAFQTALADIIKTNAPEAALEWQQVSEEESTWMLFIDGQMQGILCTVQDGKVDMLGSVCIGAWNEEFLATFVSMSATPLVALQTLAGLTIEEASSPCWMAVYQSLSAAMEGGEMTDFGGKTLHVSGMMQDETTFVLEMYIDLIPDAE